MEKIVNDNNFDIGWVNSAVRMAIKNRKRRLLEKIKIDKMWKRVNLGRKIICNDCEDGTENIIYLNMFELVGVYKQNVQKRWDKRKNDRLVRGLHSVTKHIHLDNKRRM